jgi:hypothetical protein
LVTEDRRRFGEAAKITRLRFEARGSMWPDDRGSSAVNSLGLLEVTAAGLAPNAQYQVFLADGDHEPVRRLEPLGVLKTNPDGAGIVQVIGPPKTIASQGAGNSTSPSERLLIVTEMNDSSGSVLGRSHRESSTSIQREITYEHNHDQRWHDDLLQGLG